MSVKMLKQTYYNGKVRIAGEVYSDLDTMTATRWSKNGIAEIVEYEFNSPKVNDFSPERIEQECENGACIYDFDEAEDEVVSKKECETPTITQVDENEVTDNGLQQEEGQEKEMMTPKQLFNLCKEKGLSPKAKMEREYYLELLEQEV
jgi:hypothetical protein